MSGWHNDVMVAFDTETTGLNLESDRIVTACVAVIDPGRAPQVTSWLINPGVPIPVEATAIHGITDERVAEDGEKPPVALGQIAGLLAAFLTLGVPVVGMNLAYDLTLLDRDCRRHGVDTVTDLLCGKPLAPVVDVLVLDKAVDRYRRGRRTLTALCQTYGVRTDGAHDSTHDALAAARVAWKIAHRHPKIGGEDLRVLHDAQIGWAAGQAASFAAYLRRLAEEKAHEVDLAIEAGDHEAATIALQEAAELRGRIAGVDGTWPLIPPAVTP